MTLVEKAGYRKMPGGEPPVLSPEEIYHILPQDMKGWHSFSVRDDLLPIAKAQLAADIAFYTEGKPTVRWQTGKGYGDK